MNTMETREAAIARLMSNGKPQRGQYARTIYGDSLESTLGGGGTDNKGQISHLYPSATEVFPGLEVFPT